MTKFGSQYGKTTQTGKSPLKSTSTVTTNHGGASAFARDEKSDLFLLGVMNFVGEETYYESANNRDERYNALVHNVTAADPDWVRRFVPWLRNEANMRSVSVVTAVEYGRAGGPERRSVVDSACSRADEPAEVLAYWIGKYSRPIPSWLKRGVADAAKRLYNERSLLKYDGNSKQFRFADVINLAHITPKDERQSKLFKFALDSRYSATVDVDGLPVLDNAQKVRKGDITRDQLLADPDLLKRAGMTWEALGGLGPMDAKAWEAMIPQMGYMALLRNLRNFDQAGISKSSVKLVAEKLADPEQVAKSRQLVFRFWSAYKNAQGAQWVAPLEEALGHAVKNVPELGGRTLVLVDTSGSMSGFGFSRNGTIPAVEAAAVFGAALALKGEAVDWYGFADGVFKHKVPKGASVLRAVESFTKRVGESGHGTNIPGAMAQWDGHDRVVLITDMQTLRMYDRSNLGAGIDTYGYGRYRGRVNVRNNVIPERVPVFGFNLGGYATTQIGNTNEYELGGLTDHTFKLIPLLEKRGTGEYPF